MSLYASRTVSVYSLVAGINTRSRAPSEACPLVRVRWNAVTLHAHYSVRLINCTVNSFTAMRHNERRVKREAGRDHYPGTNRTVEYLEVELWTCSICFSCSIY